MGEDIGFILTYLVFKLDKILSFNSNLVYFWSDGGTNTDGINPSLIKVVLQFNLSGYMDVFLYLYIAIWTLVSGDRMFTTFGYHWL